MDCISICYLFFAEGLFLPLSREGHHPSPAERVVHGLRHPSLRLALLGGGGGDSGPRRRSGFPGRLLTGRKGPEGGEEAQQQKGLKEINQHTVQKKMGDGGTVKRSKCAVYSFLCLVYSLASNGKIRLKFIFNCFCKYLFCLTGASFLPHPGPLLLSLCLPWPSWLCCCP